MLMRSPALLLACALLSGAPSSAASPAPEARGPGPKDKCPVCGMFVAKYPEWIAGAVLKDGTLLWFDGAKDLFKFWLDPGQYLPARRRADVRSLAVTDYYGLVRLDARKALFVLGSDVYGPMGRELIPFGALGDAEEFKRDHRGTKIVRFDEVTPDLVRPLDE
jgi:copper chaperone NosL